MNRVALMVIGVLLWLALGGMLEEARSAKRDIPYPEIPRISLNEVKELLGKPGVVLLDTRPLEQWNDSDSKLPGAFYGDPTNVKSWANKYPKDAHLIIY